MLNLDDPAVARAIETLLAQADAALSAAAQPAVDLDAMARRLLEGGLDDRLFEELGRRGSEAIDRTLGGKTGADAALRAGADRLRQAQPSLGEYAAKRTVVAAFRTAYPAHRSFMLKPESRLAPPPGLSPCPPIGPMYEHFATLAEGYWRDPIYDNLTQLRPEELPDGAMLALCPLTRFSTQALARGDDYGEPVVTLIARYGARFHPVAVEYLAHPERYGWDADIVPNVTGTRWFPPGAALPFFEAAAVWPAREAEAFFRFGLEAGWTDAGRWLPAGDWARRLWTEFSDSPYGPPFRPSWLARS